MQKADMPFIVPGPLPLITDMPFLNDWAQPACGSPGWIARGCNQQHRPGPLAVPVPALPILFALSANRRLGPVPRPASPKEKQLDIHPHSPSGRGQWGKQEGRLIFPTPRGEKLHGKANVILLLNMQSWPNLLSLQNWVEKIENKNKKLLVVFCHLHSGPGQKSHCSWWPALGASSEEPWALVIPLLLTHHSKLFGQNSWKAFANAGSQIFCVSKSRHVVQSTYRCSQGQREILAQTAPPAATRTTARPSRRKTPGALRPSHNAQSSSRAQQTFSRSAGLGIQSWHLQLLSTGAWSTPCFSHLLNGHHVYVLSGLWPPAAVAQKTWQLLRLSALSE